MQQHGPCIFVGKSTLYWAYRSPPPAPAGFLSLQAAQSEKHDLLFVGSASAIYQWGDDQDRRSGISRLPHFQLQSLLGEPSLAPHLKALCCAENNRAFAIKAMHCLAINATFCHDN